jgi:hypothetical protein
VFLVSAGCSPAAAETAAPAPPAHDDRDRHSAGFLDEWMAKAESSVPGHEPHFLHLVFEEWFGSGHVRVSVRGDGWYAVEIDGRSGWNFWGGRTRGPRRALADHFTGDKGGFPFVHHFGEFGTATYLQSINGERPPVPAFPPCPAGGDDGSGAYHASMTLTAEFASPAVLRSWWNSPDCPGFPRPVAKDAWSFIERLTRGTVRRPAYLLR